MFLALTSVYMQLSILCKKEGTVGLQFICNFYPTPLKGSRSIVFTHGVWMSTASRLNLAHLGHKKLIFYCFECSFVDFFTVH